MQRQLIKFGDVKIGSVAINYIADALDKNWVTQGELCNRFEEQWAAKNNAKYCITTNSGTSALIALFCSLYGLGARRGQNIIMPSLSFISTWNAAIAAGFNIKFVDTLINGDMNIDTAKIEEKIDENTIAICGVSLMGKPYKAEKVEELCKKYNLWHIADQCEAHFAIRQSKRILEYCDAEVYSFYTAHCIFACEFGCICTNNKDIADLCRSTRTHGRRNAESFFDFVNFGLNLKPTDLSAAIGLESLENGDMTFLQRRRNLKLLESMLYKYDKLIWLIEEEDGDVNSPHALSITFRSNGLAENFRSYLTKNNIEWKLNFRSPIQCQSLNWMDISESDCVNATHIASNGIHCGIHQFLTNDDIEYMIEIFTKFLTSCTT